MRNHWALSVLGCFAFCGTAGKALEPSDILAWSKGPFSIRPQLRVEEQFNDNIFFEETSAAADLITGITPGVQLLLGQNLPESNHVSLLYQMENLIYADHSELNAIQHHLGHNSFYKSERLTLSGSDQYDKLDSTLGSGISVGPAKVERDQLLDLYSVRYRLSERTRIHGNILHNMVDYERRQSLFDLQTVRGTLGFGWVLSDKTDIFGEVYYGESILTRNSTAADPPDRSSMGGFIGATGDFTEKLSGVAKAGYDVSSFSGPGSAGLKSVSAPVFEMDLSYRITERTVATLGYTRTQRVSVQFFSSGYTVDDVVLGASTILGGAEKLRLSAEARYGNFAYESSPALPARDDSLWGGTFRATWSFETWLSAQFIYSFENFDTSLPAVVQKYQVNRVALALQVGY